MATLLFQGHASCRLITRTGKVIYIDPFAGEGYDLPADLVLITHEHHDHNDLSKVTQGPDCVVIRSADALAGGQYHSFDAAGIHIQAVPAGKYEVVDQILRSFERIEAMDESCVAPDSLAREFIGGSTYDNH